MPPPDQLALWAAIRADPADDTPRLVYADWLDENGDPDRAELIRLQCRLGRLGPDRRKARNERNQLEARAAAVLGPNRDRWLAPLRPVLAGLWDPDAERRWFAERRFSRGFVAGQLTTLEVARRVAAAGDALEPFDRIYVLGSRRAEYRPDSVPTIAGWPGAGCVEMLDAPGGTDDDVRAVVASPYLRNLSLLAITNSGVTDAGIAALVARPPLAKPRGFNFSGNRITDAGAFALADSPHADGVGLIILSGNPIGPAGRARLQERLPGKVLFLREG